MHPPSAAARQSDRPPHFPCPDDKSIKWYEFKKKKEFNNEYDYATGTKERPDANAPEGSATANANLPWHKRAAEYMKNKWYSMRRKHQRARDSFVNEAEDFQKLNGWRKAKLIVQNPLAFIKSKTKKGRAATAKRNAQAAADDQLMEQMMNNPDMIGEDGSISLPKNGLVSSEALQEAKANLRSVDPSEISRSGKIQRISTGQHAVDEVRQAREAAGDSWSGAPAATQSDAPDEQPVPPEETPSDTSQIDPWNMSVAAKVKRYNTPDGIKAPVREDELAPWYKKRQRGQ